MGQWVLGKPRVGNNAEQHGKAKRLLHHQGGIKPRAACSSIAVLQSGNAAPGQKRGILLRLTAIYSFLIVKVMTLQSFHDLTSCL